MTSPRLQLLERKLARQTPEKIQAPASDDLAAAIERLVQERVKEALEEQQPVKQPAQVRRLTDQLNKPAPVTDFKQILPAPKTPPVIESLVSQRDEFGRIKKMITQPLHGAGPVIETVVTQRDEFGKIARMVTSRVDTAPLPPA